MSAPSSAKAAPPPEATASNELLEEDPRFRTMRRLVNALLMTLIAGVMVIVLTLAWKIKQTPLTGVTGRAADERIIAVRADADRIFITLRREGAGVERIVVLNGTTFAPEGEIADAPAAE